MKVLVWSQYFWPENFHINQVVEELSSQGVSVTVVTGKPNYPEGEIFPGYSALGVAVDCFNGIKVIRLPILGRGKGTSLRLLLNYISFIISGYFFAPWVLRGKKFDVIFVYAPSPLLQALPAILISSIKRTPLVLWVQDLWPESLQATGFINNKFLLNIVRFVVRYIYKNSSSILIQSEGFRESVQGHCINPSKIMYFPNSASDQIFTEMAEFDLEEFESFFSVVFAGNIGTAQSCSTIVEAAKILKDHKGIRFFIIGGGSMADSIDQAIKANALDNIKLLDRVSPCVIAKIYSVSSVLLLTLRDDPALSRTVPSKFQSYLSAGKPIIASCNGEVARILKDAKAGLSCPPEDPAELARSVLILFHSDPGTLSTMGRNGSSYFLSNFSVSRNVSRLLHHFSSFIDAG